LKKKEIKTLVEIRAASIISLHTQKRVKS